MSGFEVLDRLKSDRATRSIPVIIVTSHKLAEAEQQSLARRVVAVLSKTTTSRQASRAEINAAVDRALMQSSVN
jgi:CheY-like chemotaxis protein